MYIQVHAICKIMYCSKIICKIKCKIHTEHIVQIGNVQIAQCAQYAQCHIM